MSTPEENMSIRDAGSQLRHQYYTRLYWQVVSVYGIPEDGLSVTVPGTIDSTSPISLLGADIAARLEAEIHPFAGGLPEELKQYQGRDIRGIGGGIVRPFGFVFLRLNCPDLGVASKPTPFFVIDDPSVGLLIGVPFCHDHGIYQKIENALAQNTVPIFIAEEPLVIAALYDGRTPDDKKEDKECTDNKVIDNERLRADIDRKKKALVDAGSSPQPTPTVRSSSTGSSVDGDFSILSLGTAASSMTTAPSLSSTKPTTDESRQP